MSLIITVGRNMLYDDPDADHYPDAFGIKVLVRGMTCVIPAELCHVAPNQRYKGKVPGHLTSEVIAFTTKKLPECVNTILRGVSQPPVT